MLYDNNWEDDFGQTVFDVHPPSECAEYLCPLHNRSLHHMLDWPRRWNTGKAGVEVVCPHGGAHPDPDEGYASVLHVCDGCCTPQPLPSMELRVWRCVSTDGDLNYEFKHAEKEARQLARDEAMDLWMRFNDLLLHLRHTHQVMNLAAGDDPTEYAKLAQSHPDKEILLRMNMFADVDELVWARLRPVE
jgi:hypothetical protein